MCIIGNLCFHTGLGSEDYRLFTNIQATTSIEGIAAIYITISNSYIQFFFSWFLCNFASSLHFDLQGGDASVNSVHLSPKNPDHVIVCNKTSSIYLMTLQGQVGFPFLINSHVLICFSKLIIYN